MRTLKMTFNDVNGVEFSNTVLSTDKDMTEFLVDFIKDNNTRSTNKISLVESSESEFKVTLQDGAKVICKFIDTPEFQIEQITEHDKIRKTIRDFYKAMNKTVDELYVSTMSNNIIHNEDIDVYRIFNHDTDYRLVIDRCEYDICGTVYVLAMYNVTKNHKNMTKIAIDKFIELYKEPFDMTIYASAETEAGAKALAKSGFTEESDGYFKLIHKANFKPNPDSVLAGLGISPETTKKFEEDNDKDSELFGSTKWESDTVPTISEKCTLVISPSLETIFRIDNIAYGDNVLHKCVSAENQLTDREAAKNYFMSIMSHIDITHMDRILKTSTTANGYPYRSATGLDREWMVDSIEFDYGEAAIILHLISLLGRTKEAQFGI